MPFNKLLSFALGPIASALIAFLTIPLITWNFSITDVGKYSLFQVFLGLSTVVLCMGLDQAYVREYHESSNKIEVFQISFMPCLFVLILLLFILCFVDLETLSLFLFDVSDSSVLLILSICMCCSLFSRFFSLVLRMEERGMAYSLSQVLPKIIFLVVIIVWTSLGLVNSFDELIGFQMITLISVFLLFSLNVRSVWFNFDWKLLHLRKSKKLLIFGWPLVISSIAFWGMASSDKVFLKIFSTYEELGLYSVAVNFAAFGIVLQTIFSTVWSPTVYKWVSQGQELEQVFSVQRWMVILVVGFFSIAGMLSWVVTYLLPVEYDQVQWLFVACLAYPFFYALGEALGIGLGVARKTKHTMMLSLTCFAVNFIGNYFLVPNYGARGAAASTCFSFWFYYFIKTELSCYLWRKYPRVHFHIITFVVTFIAVLGLFIDNDLKYFIYLLWGFVFFIILLLNRKELINFFYRNLSD